MFSLFEKKILPLPQKPTGNSAYTVQKARSCSVRPTERNGTGVRPAVLQWPAGAPRPNEECQETRYP